MTRPRGGALRRLAGMAAVAACLSLVASAASAQYDWGYFRLPPRFAEPGSFDGAFNFCRMWFTSIARERSGSGWRTDYPSADQNFMIRFGELTKASVSVDKAGEPNFLVVRVTDDTFFQCPFVIIEDAGTAGFSDEEVERLRAYLLKGGFLWADDYWGTRAWDRWVQQIHRTLPPADYPIVDIPLDHPLFRTLYEVKRVPQIPSIQFWRRSGGQTSERGLDSADVHFRGISDSKGRLMVLMSHNTDIADGWEREGEDPDFFYRFSIESYALAINVLIYTMTH